MINLMTINNYRAAIQYDPEIEMFRGEFVGLNGGADFYAEDINGLRKEGEISLKVFLEACEKQGIKPTKDYSGKFNTRVSPTLHESVAMIAAADGRSLNTVVNEALEQYIAERTA